MNARDKVAHQLGLFFLVNLEMEELIEQQKKQIEELTKKLTALTPPKTAGE